MAGGMQPAQDPSRRSSLVRLAGYHRLPVTSEGHSMTEDSNVKMAQNARAFKVSLPVPARNAGAPPFTLESHPTAWLLTYIIPVRRYMSERCIVL